MLPPYLSSSGHFCRDCFIFEKIMSDFLLYNGSFYNSTEPIITADNRGLRYGDGLFETFKTTGETIHFMDWHFERLFTGLKLLQFEIPAYFTPSYLAGLVNSLCAKNGHYTARIRINIIRGNGGLYDPENHFPNCIIQSWPLPDAGFALNQNGLVAGIYEDAKKPMDAFSNIKSNSYLPYTMAALYAKKQLWNDAFILNTADRICDTSIANVFIIKNEILYTCPLNEGCVAGIMRRYLLERLPVLGFTVRETEISVANLQSADEVFLTNAIKGIRWVSHCETTVYTNHFTTSIFKKLFK
jgi:branched-chain amino acid aminotransferase